jgi:hypothetical protein
LGVYDHSKIVFARDILLNMSEFTMTIFKCDFLRIHGIVLGETRDLKWPSAIDKDIDIIPTAF